MTHANTITSGDLLGQTVRTVAILVGSCVLFVGMLSVAAVAITNKAMGSSTDSHATQQPASPRSQTPQSI